MSATLSGGMNGATRAGAYAVLLDQLREYAVMGALLIAMLALVGLPMGFVLISAIIKNPFNIASGFSFEAIRAVYTSAAIWYSAWQTVAMAVFVGAVATSIGALLAWILTRFHLPASGFLETTVLVPLFLSPLVGAIAWVALAAPRSGVLNNILSIAGTPDWPRLNIMSIGGIAFVMIFHYIPYGFLFLSSALRNTDANLEEASYMCGGDVRTTALKIVLPLLKSSALSSFLFISILASGEFSIPAILGANGRFVPLSVYLYNAVYGFPQDFSRATSIGTMMIIVSFTAFYFYRRSVHDSRRFVTITGRGFASRKLDPGSWRIPILTLFGLYAFITVIMPYGALLFICFTQFRTGDIATTVFTTNNMLTVLTHPDVTTALINTLELSVIVPAACVILGVALVYLHERVRLPGAGVATYIATAPIAVSGIVFATGVFVIYIYTPLYATIWLIAIALIAHYLAHSVRIASNGLSQIDVSLEEAAQLNGATRARVLRTIVAPLMRPSIFSAFILIYVFTVREVNTSILLYSPSSLPLSVLSWNYLADGSLAQAAVVGVVQTVLMVAGIVAARFLLGVSTMRSV
jgi:iron(III) transport system permease protein